MGFLWLLLFLLIDVCYSQQFYDATLCSSETDYPGTRYTCNSFQGSSCHTFLVYRANKKFQSIISIASLFQMDTNNLLTINNVSNSSRPLETGREVLVPMTCTCLGQFFQAEINYTSSENITLSDISCTVFEGLVKSITLEEEYDFRGLNSTSNDLRVPLKCACPDEIYRKNGIRYFVTYPFIEGDDTKKLSLKFNISVEEIWDVNNLDPTTTVYPNTTVIVPLKAKPFININISEPEPPIPSFLPTIPVEKQAKFIQLKKLCIIVSIVGFFLIVATLVSCSLYLKALYKFKSKNLRSLTRRSSLNSCSTPRSSQLSGPPTRGSTNSCLSPDLLVGIKYSLCNYNVDEIKQATKNFSESTRIISPSVYKGLIDNREMMIKQMRFENTRQVIDVHSKINHVNIVKLHGVCYGDDDLSSSYLLFEFPVNGSLWDCLASSSTCLSWQRRTQIAFDIATGLHYLHCCVVPCYIHKSVTSKGIFLTSNWRAKLSVFGEIRVDDHDDSLTPQHRSNLTSVAPENVLYGLATEKVDVFAYGVVLLELISGKEAEDNGKLFEESIRFFGGGANEGGCFEQLRNFVDPGLKEDYPIAEALCLAVLASSCVEQDPLHRPSMDDVIKILARLI